jgi:hypothetical protein
MKLFLQALLFFNFLIHLSISSFEIFMFMFSFSSFTSSGSNKGICMGSASGFSFNDEAILAHRRKLSRVINNLKSSNSQEFSKLLKKGKTREQPNIQFPQFLFSYVFHFRIFRSSKCGFRRV